MLDFVQQLVSGIALGCVYGLVALGFVLVYKATEVVNFAQGDLMMLGGGFFASFIGMLGLNYGSDCRRGGSDGVVGMLAERVVVRPIQTYAVFLMATIGLGYSCARGRHDREPTISDRTPFNRANLADQPHGSHIQALGDRRDDDPLRCCTCSSTAPRSARCAPVRNMLAAYYMGIPVKRVVSIVWAISAAVATCAGVLLAPITFIHSNVGLVLGLKAFPAAVLGGFGSIPGAVVGGVLIGVIESMAGFYLPQGWKDVAPYIVLLVVLLLKPEGLFGLHTRKKV
jgi:branched-chain amino acid transport system permease protein